LFRNFVIFVRQITWFRWNSWHWTSGVNVHNKNSQSICAVLTFDPQLNKILTFSVNDRYQLNYFICIKDFNAWFFCFFVVFLFLFVLQIEYGCFESCQFLVLTSEQIGRRLPVFMLLLWQRQHIIVISNCKMETPRKPCLYVNISDIRQIVGYRTPVFIQRLPWRLHFTITYDYDMLTLS
jgi:hypothetical protein